MRPPVELGVHRAPRCEPVVSLVRSRRAPPVPLIVLPKSCSCRWGPCPRPIPRLASCFLSFFGCFHNQTVREECLIHGQRGWPHRGWPQAELPTGGGFEDTEPSAPAADRRRRARFGGWLSGTVSGRPACELSPRDDRRRSIQARRHARSRPTPRPDRAVRAGMMQA